MTLFAGALLRTIEFVMVTTDASFPPPRGVRAREPSRRSCAVEQMMRALSRGAPELGAGDRASVTSEPGSSGEQLRAALDSAADDG